MLKFNSNGQDRADALDRARSLKSRADLFFNNPTINDPQLESDAQEFHGLVDQHQITDDELEGPKTPSTGLATTGDGFDFSEFFNRRINDLMEEEGDMPEAVAHFRMQPDAVRDMEVSAANGNDRDHDYALPFKVGYKKSTDSFDVDGFGKTIQQRMDEFDPSQHEDFDSDKMDNLREAYAMGMDPELYKRAIATGIPHDVLRDAFIRSARVHTVQVGDARGLNDIRGLEISETPAGAAARRFRKNNPLPTTESGSTEIAEEGFTPVRLSAMNPINIARAHKNGVTVDEMLDAWYNQGFHPLKEFGTNFTYPMSKYITNREMGLNHEQTKGVLSSLRYIPSTLFKQRLTAGESPESIVDDLNDLQDVSLSNPDKPFLAGQQGMLVSGN